MSGIIPTGGSSSDPLDPGTGGGTNIGSATGGGGTNTGSITGGAGSATGAVTSTASLPADNLNVSEYCRVVGPVLASDLTAFPVGETLGFSCLTPLAGSGLPAAVGESQITSILPASSIISVTWKVHYRDCTEVNNAVGDWQAARPGVTTSDASGHYQIVSGSLMSAQLVILPWPAVTGVPLKQGTTETVGQPFSSYRQFQLTPTVSVWWPGRSSAHSEFKSLPSVGPLTIQSWYKTFPGTTSPVLKLPASDSATTYCGWICSTLAKVSGYPGLYLDNVFSLATDTLAPAGGQAAHALVYPRDFSTLVPHVVQSVVETTPTVKIQAGIDLGAILGGIYSELKSLICEFSCLLLFDGYLNSHQRLINLIQVTGIVDDTEAEVAVESILNNIFSIPIAVDIDGHSIAKTIVPPLPFPLPMLKRSLDPSTFVGQIPISNLLMNLKVTSSDIYSTALSGVTSKPLSGTFGIALRPLPTLSGVGIDGTTSVTQVTVNMTYGLQVPGIADGDTKHYIRLVAPLPNISLTVPALKLPGILAMFHAPLSSNPSPNEILLMFDPDTATKWSNISLLRAGLKELGDSLALLKPLWSLLPSASTANVSHFANLDQWTGIVNTLQQIVTLITGMDDKHIYLMGLDGNLLHRNFPGKASEADDWWYNARATQSHDNNVSSILWVGYPHEPGTWRPEIVLGMHNDYGVAGSWDGISGSISFGWSFACYTSLDFVTGCSPPNAVQYNGSTGNAGVADWPPHDSWNDYARQIKWNKGG